VPVVINASFESGNALSLGRKSGAEAKVITGERGFYRHDQGLTILMADAGIKRSLSLSLSHSRSH